MHHRTPQPKPAPHHLFENEPPSRTVLKSLHWISKSIELANSFIASTISLISFCCSERFLSAVLAVKKQKVPNKRPPTGGVAINPLNTAVPSTMPAGGDKAIKSAKMPKLIVKKAPENTAADAGVGPL
jgi:hypothetical protein